MSTHKVVTLETLTQAMEDAQSGLEVGTSIAAYTRMVFDALPSAPLAEDVQAAIEAVQRLGNQFGRVANGQPDDEFYHQVRVDSEAITTIITALHAATAERDQANATIATLREALSHYADEDVWIRRYRGYDVGIATATGGPAIAQAALALPVPAGAERLADPEIAAVAELLLMEDAGKIHLLKGSGVLGAGKWRVHYSASVRYSNAADTAVELLAAIKAKVEEA